MDASGGAWLLWLKQHGPWKFLVQRGYAVAAVEYRVSGEARYPAGVHDLKAAVRWLRANAETHGLDAELVVAWAARRAHTCARCARSPMGWRNSRATSAMTSTSPARSPP